MDFANLEDTSGTSEITSLVTNVMLTGLPQGGPPLQFRCHLASHGLDGSLLLEQFTQPRTQPDWLVKYLHKGPGLLSVAVQFRPTPDADWFTAGEVSARPLDLLGSERGALAELPLKACRFAPDLSVSLQFSTTEARAGAAGASTPAMLTRSSRSSTSVAPKDSPAEAQAKEVAQSHAITAMAEVPALTRAEMVIVKDSWNKLLPFSEMLIEMFFERLLHEEPDLIEAFGEAIDNIATDFAALFDLAVRALLPQTETILRESYSGVPGLAQPTCGSVKDFMVLFTDLGMRPNHWLTARKIWIWMVEEIPYLENYERENLRHGQGSAAYKFFTREILKPALDSIRAYEEALTPDMVDAMARCGAALALDAKTVGIEFYRLLFMRSPEIVKYFGRTDMDHLAEHLFKAIEFGDYVFDKHTLTG